MGAKVSAGVVGAYALIIALIALVVRLRIPSAESWAFYVVLILSLLPLARYLSSRYSLDESYLRASSIFGSLRLPLKDVRAVRPASFRDLVATGGWLASWSWRGRLLSPAVGEFVPAFTDAASGLLVSAAPYPWYISPRRPGEFARELARRVPPVPSRLPAAADAGRASPTVPLLAAAVAPGTVVLFLGGDPSLATPRLPAELKGSMFGRLFLPTMPGSQAPVAHPPRDPDAPWPFPAEHVMCAQRLVDAAKRSGRDVKIVDVNRPGEDQELVARYVGAQDVLPLVVRSDGSRLEGTDAFTPAALRKFLAAS